METSQKEKLSEVLIIVGLIAFAWYKYSRLSEAEKSDLQNDIKETGKKIVKELVPPEVQGFLPSALK